MSDTPVADSLMPDPRAYELVRILRDADPKGQRLAQVFRNTFDQAYDGRNTGRFRPEELNKTEKTNIGTLVEINIRREYDDIISDGEKMDFSIGGLDVDCKYSRRLNGWMIPPEAVDQFGMVCHADDYASNWSVGFIRFTKEVLSTGSNRDLKSTINKAGRNTIAWAWKMEDLPPNVLLHLPQESLDRIFSYRSGQKRINQLFRESLDTIVPRGTIETTAQQLDPMKRVRYNGGARTLLKPEGIIILGDYSSHQAIARQLGLPVPIDSETIATRLVPADGTTNQVVELEGKLWRRAAPSDPVVEAPMLPGI